MPQVGPSYIGMSILRQRGMPSATIGDIQTVLTAYFAEHKIDEQEITRVSFAQDLTHRIENYGAINVFIVKIALNNTISRIMTITLDMGELASITLAEPRGEGATSVFP